MSRNRARPPLPIPVTILLLGLLAGLVSAPAAMAQNPFMADEKPARTSPRPPATADETPAPASPKLHRTVWKKILVLQRNLNRTISRAIREYKEKNAPISTLALLLGLCFAYGTIHALGPGHGKSVASAYFASRGGTIRQGAAMGFATAAVHALSALVIVFATHFFFEGAVSVKFEQVAQTTTRWSFGAVALIGLCMLYGALRKLLTGRHAHAHAVPDDRNHLAVAVAAGLIPCPGAALLLFFSLGLDIPATGIAAVGAMSLGMGITVTAVAVLTLLSRDRILQAPAAHSRFWFFLKNAFSLLGALAVTLLGAVLFLGRM